MYLWEDIRGSVSRVTACTLIFVCLFGMRTWAQRSSIIDEIRIWPGFAAVPSTIPKADVQVQYLVGDTARLPCSVDSTATNITVVWMDEHDNVLYYNENKIIDNGRFMLTQRSKHWEMQIYEVRAEDEGLYRCVANTNPIKIKYYQLTVFVPPRIDLDESSVDVEATEGTTVRLQCNATGTPSPVITWSARRASQPRNTSNSELIGKGDVVQVQNVSRYLDIIYTCAASNGHESDADYAARHHDIRIRVRFKPEIKLPLRKISQYRGNTVTLTCEGKGYRLPRMYFAKDSIQISDNPNDQTKYEYITQNSVDGFNKKIMLRIKDLTADDYGYYKCVALNSLGRAEKFIELKEKNRIILSTASRRSSIQPVFPIPSAINTTPRPQRPTPKDSATRTQERKTRLPDQLVVAKSVDEPGSSSCIHTLTLSYISLLITVSTILQLA